MKLNTIPKDGQWSNISDRLNDNFSKMDVAVEALQDATIKNIGYFSTADALREAYPIASAGAKAYVGVTYPFAIYLWDATTSTWVESGSTGGEESVNLGEYYTKEETDANLARVSREVEDLDDKKADKESVESYIQQVNSAIEKQDGDITEFKEAVNDQVENYKPIVINGNVTNAADEEDITSENGLLKLANRSAINGMGYVILRKDKTFAEQVTLANTIYEIRYDFDLNGVHYKIPVNCVLKFVGGKISNGTLDGNYALIDAETDSIFSDDLLLVGKFSVAEVNVGWFGAKVNSADYSATTTAIQKAINFSINCRQAENSYTLRVERAVPIKFGYGKYVINGKLQLSSSACMLAHPLGTIIEQTDEDSPIFVVDKNSYLWGDSGSGAFNVYILGFVFVGGTKQIILENSNIGGSHKIEECFFADANPSMPCVYCDTVSSALIITDCKVSHITNFLWVKADHASISNLEGSVYNKNGGLVSDGCFIVNKARMLNIKNALLTVGDGTIATYNTNYSLVENHTYLHIDGLVLDGPGGGVPIVVNYAKHIWGDWSTWFNEQEASSLPSSGLYSSFASAVIIENSTIPNGGATKSVVLLEDGVPAITQIKCCNMIDAPLIRCSATFDLDAYLRSYIGRGTITIDITNNNNSDLGYELIPSALTRYAVIDVSKNWLTPRRYIPKINTDLLSGVPCKASVIDGVLCFDLPMSPSELAVALISISYVSATYSVKPKESICGLINCASDGNGVVYLKYTELGRNNVITASAPVEISFFWVTDGTEKPAGHGAAYGTNTHLRIKVSNFSITSNYITHYMCNVLPLMLNNL